MHLSGATPRSLAALPARACAGYALLMVLLFAGLGFIGLTSVMQWSINNSGLLRRHNEFQSCVLAAEGASDRIAAQVAADFRDGGEAAVSSRLSQYRRMIPPAGESPEWAHYEFSGPQTSAGQVAVERILTPQFGDIDSKYTGLRGWRSLYRITTNVRDRRAGTSLKASVRQDLQLASVPVFGFGAFYAQDLEICPAADLYLTGRIHSNGRIYCYPDKRDLVFENHVTTSLEIVPASHPNDPQARSPGRITYRGERDGAVVAMHLPIAPNPPPALYRSLIETPPAGESRTSALGSQRFFNKADLIILVYNTNVVAASGAYNNFSVAIPWSETKRFVETNQYFFDKRENKEIQATQIDLKDFSSRYAQLRAMLGRNPVSLYVADLRTVSASRMAGVRLVEGRDLPAEGLTFATPNPLYVQGHFNAFPAHQGSANTTRAVPAALASDALILLSEGWKDSDSYLALSKRKAKDTTFNCAVITGIVPTRPGNYSGGLENALRLLEDWSGRTLTWNGSLVVLFDSLAAGAPWGGPEVYSPPTRAFRWDTNFGVESRMPAGTPLIRMVVRSQWTISQPGGS